AMWLYYWLAAHRIHPLRDVNTVVVPPPDMVGALARGELDGFCAGEPWPAAVEQAQSGYTLVSSAEIWPDHPEKVLATTRAFADTHPQTTIALTAALIEACRWLDHPAQREQAVPWVAEAIGVPEHVLAPRLIEGHGRGGRSHAARFYGRGGEVCYPWLSDGMWFLTQYRRWGLLDHDPDYLEVAKVVNRLDLYHEAARLTGADVSGIPLRRSVLIDGRLWDGSDPQAYAASFAIRA
ncbi:MAG TPA: ABC transporter substrate-binding protein, partial [Chitinolyticbacter sp.]|nr:ABC transporter substrate-binding protein [Chitinolyticbacter sp.]